MPQLNVFGTAGLRRNTPRLRRSVTEIRVFRVIRGSSLRTQRALPAIVS